MLAVERQVILELVDHQSGEVIDHLGPEYVWYFAAIIGTLTALGYRFAISYALYAMTH